MSLSKILYNVIEANQILNGPCKRKGSEYNRLLRMLKKGVVESMKNGDRYVITKKTLIDHAGSEKIFEEKLRNLYEQKILKNNVNNSEKKKSIILTNIIQILINYHLKTYQMTLIRGNG